MPKIEKYWLTISTCKSLSHILCKFYYDLAINNISLPQNGLETKINEGSVEAITAFKRVR